MNKKLNGKIATVTGSSKGLGAAITKALAVEGASVVVNYNSSKNDANKVVAEIKEAGGKVFAVQADLSTESGAKDLISATIKHYGQLDILVNNAGIYRFANIEDITMSDTLAHFNLNVFGPLCAIQAALPHLKEGSSIINISSIASKHMFVGGVVYTAAKCALDGITGVLGQELGVRKIRINSINPGLIETEGAITEGSIGGEFETLTKNLTPLGRTGIPSDISSIAVFLASDDSKWITGERLSAAGGMR